MRACWLQRNGLLEMPGRLVPVHLHPVLNACSGPLDPVHLIPQQLLKRELGSRKAGYEMVTVAGCRRHHSLLDVSRRLRIPREALPESVEQFAADHGLVWFLEREYGFPHSRAEPSEGDHQGESVPSPQKAGGSAG